MRHLQIPQATWRQYMIQVTADTLDTLDRQHTLLHICDNILEKCTDISNID